MSEDKTIKKPFKKITLRSVIGDKNKNISNETLQSDIKMNQSYQDNNEIENFINANWYLENFSNKNKEINIDCEQQQQQCSQNFNQSGVIGYENQFDFELVSKGEDNQQTNDFIIDLNGVAEKRFLQQFNSSIHIINQNLRINQYFLKKYLACGGQRMIFEGVRKIGNQNPEEYVFKIYFDIQEEEYEEEFKILRFFETNINTIKLIDSIKISESLFIQVLEKCEKSLKDELNQIQQNEIVFTRQKLFQMIFDLLDGLAQFRIYNILHLDIKPHNILVSSQGHYIYTDFGASEVYLKNKKIKNKAYTVKYASLEQIQNLPNISFISDVYSLGVTFQQVFQIYYQKNRNDGFILDIEKIVINSMIQNSKEKRDNCLQLHEKFIELFINNIDLQVIQQQKQKINLIIQLIPFDLNKDILYYQELKLYQQRLLLKIQQKIIFYEISINYSFALPPDNIDSIGKLFDLFETSQNTQTQSQEKSQFIYRNFLEIARSMNEVSKCYYTIGNLQNAFKYSQESLKIKKQIYKETHPELAQSLNEVGIDYFKIGDIQNALKYFQESLQMAKQYFKGNHPDIAIYLNNVGFCFKEISDYHNSLKYLLESLEMVKQLGHENSISIELVMNNIGSCYKSLGDQQIALKYCKQSLKIKKKLIIGNHPEIAIYLNNVGLCYLSLCEFQKALKYILESLQMLKQLFKRIHPYTATLLNNVGECYNELGDYQKALKYSLQYIEIRKCLFNGNHLDIELYLNKVGICYKSFDNTSNTIKYILESLQLVKKFLLEIIFILHYLIIKLYYATKKWEITKMLMK